MPFPIDAEASTVEREAQSIIGTAIAQVLGIVRGLIEAALRYVQQFVVWAGENPKATSMLLMNMLILFSV